MGGMAESTDNSSDFDRDLFAVRFNKSSVIGMNGHTTRNPTATAC